MDRKRLTYFTKALLFQLGLTLITTTLVWILSKHIFTKYAHNDYVNILCAQFINLFTVFLVLHVFHKYVNKIPHGFHSPIS